MVEEDEEGGERRRRGGKEVLGVLNMARIGREREFREHCMIGRKMKYRQRRAYT